MISSLTGTLSRISFHHPPTFVYFDIVLTISRFLRTKKDISKYKYKEEEVISRMICESSSDETNSRDSEGKFLSYGTV